MTNEMSAEDYQSYLVATGQRTNPGEPRTNKYGAIPTVVDGIRFASKAEAKYYVLLKHRLDAGEIESLELQPRYPLSVNGTHCGAYVADFAWYEDGKVIVCDVKGKPTPVYRLKKKLMKAIYDIEIMEVKA